MLLQIEIKAQAKQPLSTQLNRALLPFEQLRFQFGEGCLLTDSSKSKETLCFILKPNVYQLIDYQRQLPEVKISKNDYLSTRPFLVSAFFSQMIARFCPTALAAKNFDEGSESDSLISLAVLKCSKGSDWLQQVFSALNWRPQISNLLWDQKFTTWGKSPFFSVEIQCKDKLPDILKKLYALLPILDEDKKAWLSSADLEVFEAAQSALMIQYPALTPLVKQPENTGLNVLPSASGDDFKALPELNSDLDETTEDLDSLRQTKAWLEESLEKQTLLNDTLQDILRHYLQNHSFKLCETRLMGKLPIPLSEYMTAVNVVNQIPIHPKRLIYQPPTMCFPATSKEEGYLEHPSSIFDYYKRVGVKSVVCEQKHMGGRISLLVCKQKQIAKKCFALADGQRSSCLYRVKPNASAFEFLDWEHSLREKGLFQHIETLMDASGIWDSTEANWLLLDCELMPWAISNEPIEEVTSLYAGLSAAGLTSLNAALAMLTRRANHNEFSALLEADLLADQKNLLSFQSLYRGYSAPVNRLEDIKVAPFHVLASDKGLYTDASHEWHLKIAEILAKKDPLNVIQKTEYRCVNLENDDEQASAIRWWHELTDRGEEGIVIKPTNFTEFNNEALVQPAIKCRGKNYIRMVYGPNYQNYLDGLKQRVTSTKERLAFFEYALGLEGLTRLIEHKPTHKVLECYIATLALECSYNSWRKK